ncbi:MAG: acyl-CoA thioesterase [Holophagaceae bacterium]|nr:acyl-CoA thioesterase [Holophagaceae bacterium]
MIFRCQKLIRFAHCDPAGIVFYPRYIELCVEAVEDWFNQGLGISFWALHEEHRLGIPAVHLDVNFISPSRHGDSLDFLLSVARIGKSSMTLDVIVECEGQRRFREQIVVVMVSLDTMRSVPITEAWRLKFSAFMEHERI